MAAFRPNVLEYSNTTIHYPRQPVTIMTLLVRHFKTTQFLCNFFGPFSSTLAGGDLHIKESNFISWTVMVWFHATLRAHWLDLVMRVLLFRVPETCCFKPKCKAWHIYNKKTSLNIIPKYEKLAEDCQKLPKIAKTAKNFGGLRVYSF